MRRQVILPLLLISIFVLQEAKAASAAFIPLRVVGAVAGMPIGAACGLVGGLFEGASDTTMVLNPSNVFSPVTVIAKPFKIIGGAFTGAIKGIAKGATRGAGYGWKLGSKPKS